ncbi:type II secretion system GspH family protein [Pseudoalteromonas phenolica]|uniref:type II secretion system GspH family protein n=1 Tax=Pseudoalteromonas phenolica TaxID=161398 RepID=UPI001F50354F|nr:type II secretion system GspH family protein [Pseudoalteromonas phenolica]
MKQQSGFTLIKVMLMSTMASVVVIGALKETVIQERLTGNFQKDMNARLLAEKGIFTAANNLQKIVSDNSSFSVDDLVNQHGLHVGNGEIGDDTVYKARLSKSAEGLLEITSLGQRYYGDANQQLVARFELKPADIKSPFQHAVTGCKGVNLSGSGVVDSYDSSKGPYSETNRDSSGHVNTVIGDSSVTITGNSPIKGDVKASGVIYLKGSSPIIGDVHSNTGVEISGGGGTSYRVEGNVYSGGFFYSSRW